MLKKFIAGALAAAALLAVPASSSAQSDIFAPGGIRCVAQSGYATGVGIANYLSIAQNRALYECSIRTPYGATCVVVNCNYL